VVNSPRIGYVQPDMTIVHCNKLSHRFGKRWAYANIDLSLAPKERILLIGANGSGKTTLLRSIATLLPPTQGELKIFGLSPDKDRESIRGRIGFLSHRTGLYEDLSAVENLICFARLMHKELDIASAQSLVQRVGLEVRSEPLKAYSAGMRKRASLALLLLQEPELILLDEPFSALDPTGVDEISQILSQMDAAMILVSHQVERAAKLCHRAILLENGLIRWQGSSDMAWKAWRASQQVSP
jgi:heme exporter protein A